ncbi:MAG: bifunctional phosphopantothenoylcysteine decarboxylase/phosphopantothenate--cysteine ligase CoaBC [Crocinitomicaceae bacterium]|nr:bifunctional phosphopantothenoylcysteine decarboxylase/phosphopantothenate--cysteine ligase CoaBC [Crocinitomicaceae bacterium]MCF8410055.1 bifunctional phosphopantothenoylcysteine decarboxylase/phosphopantothenate--cysteine ligase CoaBC [Crocinitomicaceae bacterium]MCF8444280.1 bifunctional phosphopantothenoylcysteine decarboxylase/phosphopantothenate--cysteine ligase CoaBC [Crocinitomicaceae bacterium]
MRPKRVLIGVTAGIAAYKIPILVRLFKKAGFDVRCVITPESKEFVSPLVLSVLSGSPVYSTLINEDKTWNNHVELAEWADFFLIAPLTANTLAKMASGICDNLLLSVYFSMKSQTIVAPAMDLDMYRHPTVLRNLDMIQNDGVFVIPAEFGPLASGLTGQGRMAEPETIFKELNQLITDKSTSIFTGKSVLITAGPTYEAIDPVRFIGNHSTGKMGFALAEVLLKKGANVKLITGPTNLELVDNNLELISINSAEEMFQEVRKHWSNQDIGIFSAAVADYRPKVVSTDKIKKNSNELLLELIKNPDILHWAGQMKKDSQFLVGFALETTDEIAHATQKLERKNLDCIILNSLQDSGAGFATDTNKVTILDKQKNKSELSLKSKYEIAQEIVLYLEELIAQ